MQLPVRLPLTLARFFIVAGLVFSFRELPAAPIDPQNILVSLGTGGYPSPKSVLEFTPDGTLVQTIPFNYNNRAYPTTEDLRDIAVDWRGTIDSFNGTFVPFLTRYSPNSNNFTHRALPGWSTYGDPGDGGIATFEDFVFLNNYSTFAAGDNGVIRYNTADGTYINFDEGIDTIDLNIGLDGLLYVLSAGGNVDVFDPVTLAFIRHITISISEVNEYLRSIAVDATGRIFASAFYGHVYRADRDGNIEVSKALSQQFGLGYLRDIDIDEKGRVIVAEETGHVLLGDSTLSAFNAFFAASDHEHSPSTIFVSFAHALPVPLSSPPPSTPTPAPTATPAPVHDIFVNVTSGVPSNCVREFTPAGLLIRTVPFIYNNGSYPIPELSEYLRDIVVDENGFINGFNGTFDPFLTRYSLSSHSFNERTFPGWSTWNGREGGIAAFHNFIYVTDMATGGPPEAIANGIVRFDVSNNTAARFAQGTDFIDITVGLDNKVYALYPVDTFEAPGGTDINIYDPVTMALIGHVSVPTKIYTNDHIRNLAVDQAGRIFLTGFGGTVYRLNNAGILEKREATGFNDLTDVAVDETGRLALGQIDGHVILGYTTLDWDSMSYFQQQGMYTAFKVVFGPMSSPTPAPTPGPAVPVISVTVSPAQVTEGNVATFTVWTSTVLSERLWINYSLSGRARNGIDYSVYSYANQAVIEPGQSWTGITLTSYYDGLVERNEAATLTLKKGAGYKLSKNNKKATVTIVNTP